MDDTALIEQALVVVNDHRAGDAQMGQVGAALVTADGNVYRGVCIDTPSSMGFCAEHAAIGAMVTAGEYVISRVVAVSIDAAGARYVLPPCGRCREFIRQIDERNEDADVIVEPGRTVKLRDLLPDSDWARIP
jgi:cytidine deaminase